MSFIYKYKTSRGFIKGVSGGRFILIIKWHYPHFAFTHNPGMVFLFSVNSTKDITQEKKTKEAW